ncbi:MAG: alpha/beta hydrolase [Chloroflexota bacterium]
MARNRPSPKKGCLAQAGIIAINLVVIVSLVLLAGYFYQQRAQILDAEKFPPAGELVDVDGTLMHIHCEGEGSPTVVFESGLGDDSLIWYRVREEVAETTRTCVYDRIGLGWSEFADTFTSSTAVANRLNTLLENAGESAPFLLVGHSAGGIYVRQYAEQYPDDVAGLVLIDSAHENQATRLPEEIVALNNGQSTLLTVCQIAAPFGLPRLLNSADNYVSHLDNQPELREQAVSRFYQTHFCAASLQELQSFNETVRQTTPPDFLGDLPIVVLTAGESFLDNPEQMPRGLSIDQLEAADETWQIMQRELANLSMNGVQVTVNNAEHHIHLDQPNFVINAITEMVENIRLE